MKKQEPKTIQIPEGYMARINGDKIEFVKLAEPRWRAEYGGTFYLVSADCQACCEFDSLNGYDTRIYNAGNYFRTKEQAEHAAEAIRELLKKYHVNNK